MSSGGSAVKCAALALRRAEQLEQRHESSPSIRSQLAMPRNACSTEAQPTTSSCTSEKASVRTDS